MATGRWKARNSPARARWCGVHRQQVLPVQLDPPAGDLVTGVAHDGEPERALARAVRAHQGVDLAPANLQTHAP